MNENIEIFSTGVFLKPERVKINGDDQWRWVAVGFEDDSFLNGDIIIPYEYSNSIDNLIEKEQ